MKAKVFFAVMFASFCPLAAQPENAGAAPVIQRHASAARSGFAAAVRVADVPLVFTGQVFAPTAGGDGRSQTEAALRALDARLAKGGGDLARVVRLHAYVADEAAVEAVEAAVATRFATSPVAFTLVRTPLAVPGARVAFEAVAVSSRSAPVVEVLDDSVAVLPAGGKVFISGQAEKGADLAAAVRQTMAGLRRSLAHLGLNPTDVVQVKAFIRPFADHGAAVRAVAEGLGGAAVPPIVVMEWQSELFAEIELIASARALAGPVGDTVAYAWLPWLVKSPRYSHVCHVGAGTPLIFVGAVNGGDAGEPREQLKIIFERLGSTLFEAGGSYRNLVKATYYLGDARARAVLGEIRGVYFDPARPPAASALNVGSLGHAGRAAMLDLIAVPAK